MRMQWLVGLAMLAAPLAVQAQDTVGSVPTEVWASAPTGTFTFTGSTDTVAIDTVVTPPIGLPTPTEPGWRGWVQGIVNEYAFPLLTFLSSGLVLLVSRRWPAFARFGAAIKVGAMLAGAMGFYALIRWIGGTVPESLLAIIAEGFGPIVVAVLTAMGVYNVGQAQKAVVADARNYASLKPPGGR
jgi:hypothetical protein